MTALRRPLEVLAYISRAKELAVLAGSQIGRRNGKARGLEQLNGLRDMGKPAFGFCNQSNRVGECSSENGIDHLVPHVTLER